MKRKALLIGINKYTSNIGRLRGSINDVNLIEQLITKDYNFAAEDIKLLLDEQATAKNILAEVDWLVAAAEPGDVLFMYYSGHGAQILNEGNDLEEDGYDEILCPIDFDWKNMIVKDDELHERFSKIPTGVNLTAFFDCCYSGGNNDGQYIYDPTELLLEGAIAGVKRVCQQNYEKLKSTKKNQRKYESGALMISACREDQLAHEAMIGGQVYGVATSFLTSVLVNNNFDIDYKTLIEKTTEQISATRFDQTPVLSGPKNLFDRKFLQSFT